MIFQRLIAETAGDNNDARKIASEELRQRQLQNPRGFLEYATAAAVSQEVEPAQRFIIAATLLEFATNSWQIVDEESRKGTLGGLLNCVSSQHITPLALGRKLAAVVARILRSDYPAGFPTVFGDIVGHIASTQDGQIREQLLLTVHLALKQLVTKIDGDGFDAASQGLSPLVTEWIGQALGMGDLALLSLCLKIALRVYGSWSFVPDGMMSCLTTFQALRSSAEAQKRSELVVRALERCVKVVLKAVSNFGQSLGSVQGHFYDALLSEMEWAIGVNLSEKLSVRAMSMFLRLLERAESDIVSSTILNSFLANERLAQLLRTLIAVYFSDTADEGTSEWADDPERFVIAFDINSDEEDVGPCAEQLFQAIVLNSDQAKSAAWEIVNRLLSQGNESEVCAALHALGLGYGSLAEGQQDTYNEFLKEKLLPLLYSYTSSSQSSSVSLLVLRRVIWVIGMWCESVPAPDDRLMIHTAFNRIIVQGSHPVILLTTFRSTEHFISDNNFTTQELPDELASQLLAAVQGTLPLVHTPDMVKELAGLVYVFLEKHGHGGPGFGEAVLDMFAPSIAGFIGRHPQQEESGEDTMTCEAFCTILTSLTTAVYFCSSPTSIWSLFSAVRYCVDVDNCVHLWTEDPAWDLLLAMVAATPSLTPNDNDVTEQVGDALSLCLANLEREFESFPTCVRTISAIVLLLPSMPDIALSAVANAAVKLLEAVVEGPPFEATYALCEILFRCAPELAVQSLMPTVCNIMNIIEEMDSEPRAPQVAALFARGALLSPEGVAPYVAAGSTIPEKLVLVLDTVSSMYVSRMIIVALNCLVKCGAVTAADDVGMIAEATRSELANSSEETPNVMYRDLLWVDKECPHSARLEQLVAVDPVVLARL